MPTDKDLKRLVRARMERTGESYTAARAQLLKKRHPPEEEYAALAGMSDEAVEAKTGKTWAQWVEALDAVNATAKPHREIAAHVHETYDDVSGWWAQTVTVGYERIRGLREAGQRRGGGFDVNKRKTVPVPVDELYTAFADPSSRAAWMPGAEMEVRTATPAKSIRLSWNDGTPVDVYFIVKGERKSAVSLQHRKLPDKETADRVRAQWTERLAALAAHLTEKTGVDA